MIGWKLGFGWWLPVALVLLFGCSTPAPAPSAPSGVPTHEPERAQPQAPTPAPPLSVRVLYPKQDTEVEMGQSIKFLALVEEAPGKLVGDAEMTLTLTDPSGRTIDHIGAVADSDATFRSAAFSVPHRSQAGTWSVTAQARKGSAQGNGTGHFQVKNSTSEMLLGKYGFWVDAPTLRGITPQLVAEKGDARNGMIIWGGIIGSIHILPANFVEIHWREGNWSLANADAVKEFMLAQLGDLGFTPIRDLGPFEQTRFKNWNAWRVGARGQFKQDQMEWMVFYAPEMNKTYAIGTTVVQPPVGIDPHAQLRDNFALFPDVNAAGVAPEPLRKLLPGPQLESPALGAPVVGTTQPVVLKWKPVKELGTDEYYRVMVDYNYEESNPTLLYTTRQTQLVLPEELYHMPNCHVFNWQVTLMRQTGQDDKGQPLGQALSYDSLYWYLIWSYPPGDKEPFPVKCPNAQF